MAVFDHPPDDEGGAERRRGPLLAGLALLVVLAVVVAWWLFRPAPAERSTDTAPAVASAPAPRESPSPAPAPEPEPAKPGAPRRARPTPRLEPAPAPEPAAPEAPALELVVESDVEGALVFVDRKFVGNAPARTSDITPGPHQVNVSAEGYEGVARTVDVAESGPTTVTVRLKEVRLDLGVDVVHKHAMGSCQGRLTADLTGLRYAPRQGGDAFTLPFAALEGFENRLSETEPAAEAQGREDLELRVADGERGPALHLPSRRREGAREAGRPVTRVASVVPGPIARGAERVHRSGVGDVDAQTVREAREAREAARHVAR